MTRLWHVLARSLETLAPGESRFSRHEASETMMPLQDSQPHTIWPDRRTFWRHKRVTVTGGSGFLGSFVPSCVEARPRGVHMVDPAILKAVPNDLVVARGAGWQGAKH